MKPIDKAIAHVGGVSRLAEKIGVSPQAVCFWRDGKRQMPVQHCTTIECLTSGAVTRQELRPDDWQAIWPELISQAERKAA